MDGLATLVAPAWHVRRVDGSLTFLLALDQDAVQGSGNHRWFKARYERFADVERIVMPAEDGGRGYARALHADLAAAAAARGYPSIAGEAPSRSAARRWRIAAGRSAVPSAGSASAPAQPPATVRSSSRRSPSSRSRLTPRSQ